MGCSKYGFLGGVDIGGTKTRVGVVSLSGEVLISRTEPVVRQSASDLVRQVIVMLRDCEKELGCDPVSGIGVAVPAVVDRCTRVVEFAPNLACLNGYPLEHAIAHETKTRTVTAFDGFASALGESWCGSGRFVKNMAFIIVGTGVGGGIVLNGKGIPGADGIAGCIGWTLVPDPDTGSPIHLESVCSGPGIAGRANRLKEKVADNTLWTAKDVFEAAKSGHEVARQVIDDAVRVFGMGIANLVSVINPEVVVLGGSVGLSLGSYIGALSGYVSEHAQPVAGRTVRIRLSSLGDDFGVIGAARLVHPDCMTTL